MLTSNLSPRTAALSRAQSLSPVVARTWLHPLTKWTAFVGMCIFPHRWPNSCEKNVCCMHREARGLWAHGETSHTYRSMVRRCDVIVTGPLKSRLHLPGALPARLPTSVSRSPVSIVFLFVWEDGAVQKGKQEHAQATIHTLTTISQHEGLLLRGLYIYTKFTGSVIPCTPQVGCCPCYALVPNISSKKSVSEHLFVACLIHLHRSVDVLHCGTRPDRQM